MKPYHKIHTVFKRNPRTNYKTLLEGYYYSPVFEYLADNHWLFTEKINGFNTRITFNGVSIVIAGRTNKDQLPEKTITALNDLFQPKLKEFKKLFKDGVCLYGETYGAKTTKGSGNYRSDQGFVLFDILIGQWWLKHVNILDVSKQLNIDIAPIIGEGTLSDMVEMARKGFNSTWGDFQAEGIVARPEIRLQGAGGKRIITKIKCKDFPKEPA